MTTKNKGPCLLCFCLVLSLLTFDFEHCSLKALSQPVSFLQSVHGVLKLIESPWDRRKIFNKKCIIPSNFFTNEDVTATKEFLRISCGMLLRVLYLAIDCALAKYLRTAHGVLRGFFAPCKLCALRVVIFFKYWWFDVYLYNCMENKQELKLKNWYDSFDEKFYTN